MSSRSNRTPKRDKEGGPVMFFDCICMQCKKSFKSRVENELFCSRRCEEKSKYINCICKRCNTSFKYKIKTDICHDCERDVFAPLEQETIPTLKAQKMLRDANNRIMEEKQYLRERKDNFPLERRR